MPIGGMPNMPIEPIVGLIGGPKGGAMGIPNGGLIIGPPYMYGEPPGIPGMSGDRSALYSSFGRAGMGGGACELLLPELGWLRSGCL